MEYYRNKEEEKKRKRKGYIYSFGFHSFLLLLFLFPFLKQSPDKEFEEVVLVEFSNAGSSREGASSSEMGGGAAEIFEPQEEARERPEVEIKSPVVNTTPDILTSKNSDIIVPTRNERPEQPERKSPTPVVETSKPSETTIKTPTREVPKVKVDVPKTSRKPSTSSGGSGSGEGGGSGEKVGSGSGSNTGSGKGGSGTGSKGDGNESEGDGGKGKGDGLFGDIGKLWRPVESKPNIGPILVKNGVYNFRVCINPVGKVKKIAFEPMGSTIKDKALIKKAVDLVSRYVFEQKPGAPSLECGIYTITVNNDTLESLRRGLN